jgi:hypothetical protein
MSCADSQNLKKGNGVTTQFNFDFPYNKQSDVNVSLLNQTTEKWEKTSAWSWANATTIEFDTAPPTPNPDVANIKIWRLTSVEPLDAVFNPGSAIRAEDLNSNFEQLQFAAEEARCSSSDLVDGGIDLENLGDVEIGNIQDGQIIEWDGTNWVNTDWHQSDWLTTDKNAPSYIKNVPDSFGITYLGNRDCVNNGPVGDEIEGGFYVNTTAGIADAGWGLAAGTTLSINDRLIKQPDDSWDIFGTGTTVSASDEPPTSAIGGDLWWDSGDTTALYFYYVDDDGGQWVPCTPSGGVVGSDEITNGSVTPEKLSTGGPDWDTSGNLTVDGGATFGGYVYSTRVIDSTNTGSAALNGASQDGSLASFIAIDRQGGGAVESAVIKPTGSAKFAGSSFNIGNYTFDSSTTSGAEFDSGSLTLQRPGSVGATSRSIAGRWGADIKWEIDVDGSATFGSSVTINDPANTSGHFFGAGGGAEHTVASGTVGTTPVLSVFKGSGNSTFQVTADGSVSAPNACTAWVNFAGANGALRGSFNVNGPITRLGTQRRY